MTPEEFGNRLGRCLSHLLSSVVKEQDAPASSWEHRNNAILILAELLPEFKTGNTELDNELASLKETYRAAYGNNYDRLFSSAAVRAD